MHLNILHQYLHLNVNLVPWVLMTVYHGPRFVVLSCGLIHTALPIPLHDYLNDTGASVPSSQ